jgi:hypothetical protein
MWKCSGCCTHNPQGKAWILSCFTDRDGTQNFVGTSAVAVVWIFREEGLFTSLSFYCLEDAVDRS